MKKDSYKNWIITFLLLIIISGGYVLYRLNHNVPAEKTKSEAAVVLDAQTAHPQDITVSQGFIGRVVAVNSVNLVPYLSGYIESIPVNSGQPVEKGDVLIVLRQDEYKAAYASAYAAVLSSNADLQNAEKQYQRLLKAGNKAVSQTELDNAQTAYLTAQAAAKQAEAAFETARINLNYTLVRAPFDGVLGNIDASVGAFISPSTNNLVRIVQYDPARVAFSVTDKEFLQRENILEDKAVLWLADGSKYPHAGKIVYTENALDQSTNTLVLYAEFANPQQKLIPNAYVKIFLEHVYKQAVVLPKRLLQFKDDGSYAYVVRQGVVELVPVEILAEQEDNYVLKNTFLPEDYIVLQDIDANLLGKKVQTASQKSGEM